MSINLSCIFRPRSEPVTQSDLRSFVIILSGDLNDKPSNSTNIITAATPGTTLTAERYKRITHLSEKNRTAHIFHHLV